MLGWMKMCVHHYKQMWSNIGKCVGNYLQISVYMGWRVFWFGVQIRAQHMSAIRAVIINEMSFGK